MRAKLLSISMEMINSSALTILREMIFSFGEMVDTQPLVSPVTQEEEVIV